MKLIKIFFILSLITLTGCGGAEYTYNFEQGRSLEFINGKWILNKPYTNYDDEKIYRVVKREFEKILGDSLYEISELRQNNRLVELQIPLYPSPKDLKDLRINSTCDYLINIHAQIVKDEMDFIVSSRNSGTTKRTNEARSEIIIYDLKNLQIISKSSVTGIVEVTKTKDDDGLDFASSGGTIILNGLARLIRKYKKNMIKIKIQ